MERTAAVYIEAPYDDVWRHLTEAGAYEDWSSAPAFLFGDTAGDPVAWGTARHTVYSGKLLSIEKGKGFSHSFAFEGFGFDETTKVHVDVREQGPVVLVAVRHDCAKAPKSFDMLGPHGWTKSLCRLKTLLETDDAMPWPVE